MKINSQKISVLITSHNRKKKTLSCLNSLFKVIVPKEFTLHVFIVDDGSIDGTDIAVKEQFPEVTVIKGDGNLFWNKGMRLAWSTASNNQDYDFYLWLNDDTLLSEYAILELLQCYQEAILKDNIPAIVCGACSADSNNNNFTYGGRKTLSEPVIPNGRLQTCKFINGNAVLISRTIYKKVGMLSLEYTHAIGDFDYGLRAIQAGFNCYTTKNYIATCPLNEGLPSWFDPNISFIKRWKSMHSPKGLNINEYNIFRRKFWGWKWIIYATKAYLKSMFPACYLKASNKQ